MFDDDYLAAIEHRISSEAETAILKGTKVIGVYCAFTPKELISAVGAIPVSLCSGTQIPIALAEEHLPRNLCALIKSSYGHAVGQTCPYFQATDMLIADATCDGKKKMYELLGRLRPLYLLQLPQTAENSEARDYWRREVVKIKKFLEEFSETEITETALFEQIKIYNCMRDTISEAFALNTGPYPLLSGRELNNITSSGGFDCNLTARIADIHKAIALAKDRGKTENYQRLVSGKPRILLTGCPTTNVKVLELIETSGAIVVATENCGGMKTVGERVEEEGDLLSNLADRYLRIACSCMTPNHRRMDLIRNLISEFRIDGVIDLTWEGCHTYNIESYLVEEFVGKYSIPYLHITTDYSENDTGQLKTRVEAFLELLSCYQSA